MAAAVIFDVDGTLVDSVGLHAEAWRAVLARWGHDVAFETVRSKIGKGGDQLMPDFLSEGEIQRDGEAIESERGTLFLTEYMPKVTAFPGVARLFQAILDRGIRIALGSSGDKTQIEHYRAMLGIDEMDLVVTSSEDAKRSKPHPDIFNAALEQLGLPAASVVAVGDTPYDAEAAGKAGIRSVGVLCGGFAEADLRRAGCLEIYGGPEDLLARLGESLVAR